MRGLPRDRRPAVALSLIGLTAALTAACTTASDGGGPPTSVAFSGPPVVTESASDPADDQPTETPTPTSGVSAAGVCPGEHLTPRVIDKGRRGAYYWVVISLTNRGPHTCRVVGYPQLAATGTSPFGLAQTVTLPVRVAGGTVGNRRDAGAHSLGVPVGASVSFAVSAYTGLQRHWTITGLAVRPAGAYGAARVAVTLPSSQNGVQSIPLTATAFVAGAGGPALIPTPKRTTRPPRR